MERSRRRRRRKKTEERLSLFAALVIQSESTLESAIATLLSSSQGKTAWNQSSEFLKGPVDARDSAVAVRARANSARHSTALKGYVPPHKLDYSYRPPEEAPSLPFAQSPTYNRHATRATEKTRTFAHSGVFEFNGQEGQWMWSDTASCVRESPGDVVKVTNPNALNFASPTTTL